MSLQFVLIISDSRGSNISKSFTRKMAAKTSWHSYGTKSTSHFGVIIINTITVEIRQDEIWKHDITNGSMVSCACLVHKKKQLSAVANCRARRNRAEDRA